MKKFLESCGITGLGFFSQFPTKATSQSDVLNLLQKLQPYTCGKNLIRIGPNGDGGYLVPDDLENIEACFSPGVDFVSGFEKEIADLGINVFLADKSVERPADEHERFQFTKKFIGATTNDDFMTLDNWVESSVPSKTSDLLLQIDIEGYEYEVFLSTPSDVLNRFRVVVAEFHNLNQLWNKPFFDLASSAIEKLLQTHSCVHIHPNNCSHPVKTKLGLELPRVMEFTFLRNDRFTEKNKQSTFPNSLDVDNTSDRTLDLPKCWYELTN